MPNTYTFENLPQELKEVLTNSYHCGNIAEHRESLHQNATNKHEGETDLFSSFMELEETKTEPISATYETSKVKWATDNYAEKGEGYQFNDKISDLSIIIPRVEKSKTEQKARVKQKAEVFTPSWVCNIQNNLIDDHMLYEGVFNTPTEDKKNWIPNPKKIKFTKQLTWLDYVLQKRIEFTAGEAPYLISRYDTTTGNPIPVKNSPRSPQKGWARIGVLDRKLRAVTENVDTTDWYYYARLAFLSTFGYEWQGDNLLLARLNMLNTFIDYYQEIFKTAPTFEQLSEIANIASWNLWQMDGLKMVEPLTCSETCEACRKKKRFGHDGKVSTIRTLTPNGFLYKNFEDFIYGKI